ncbi:hypothetical protein [Caulobacter sp. UNC279MFTsu5.1]|uniref:hypothetical protein n=1 Tax=Caulobacter sp. UNC279MFTsu5.1 TaxID=1502775 RepID=UPI0015A6054B|nr:hypothetical protein [Caulobacter sp. UNC279MFTsu5.1]
MKPGFTKVVGLALSIPATSAAVIIPPRTHAISAAIGPDTGLPRRGTQGASGDKAGIAAPDRAFFGFRASPYGAQLL